MLSLLCVTPRCASVIYYRLEFGCQVFDFSFELVFTSLCSFGLLKTKSPQLYTRVHAPTERAASKRLSFPSSFLCGISVQVTVISKEQDSIYKLSTFRGLSPTPFCPLFFLPAHQVQIPVTVKPSDLFDHLTQMVVLGQSLDTRPM